MGRSEVKNIVEKLKKRKAAEEDDVPNEVWKYVGERMEEWVWSFCSRVWRGEGQWRDEIIVLLVKKGVADRGLQKSDANVEVIMRG